MSKKLILGLLAMMVLSASMAQAGTLSVVDLPATGTDDAIGINSGKTYTHTFDFGSNAPVTINDVAFEQGPTAGLSSVYTGTSSWGYGYTIDDTRRPVDVGIHAGGGVGTRWSRNAFQMTTTRITQIFNNASPLQAAGRTYCEYTFYITRPAFALCAEAALTPQYTLTHNTLGNIISRLYAWIMHKCPEMFTVVDNPAALAGQNGLEQRETVGKADLEKALPFRTSEILGGSRGID